MSVTLIVPDEITQAAEKIAQTSGASLETLLLTALSAHFPPLPDDLRDELAAWDQAADDDMTAFLEREGIE